MTRSAQIELTFEGEPRPVIARLRPVVAPEPRASAASPRPASVDWTGVRDGVREVVLTLLATLAIGLGWAAIEAGWATVQLVRTGAPACGPGTLDVREQGHETTRNA